MGQIVATSLGSGAPGALRAPASASTEQAAFNRSIAGAASALNASGILGENRELSFSVDRATHRPIIRILDVNTNEVIEQWPPEYVLELAAQTKSSTRDSV